MNSTAKFVLDPVLEKKLINTSKKKNSQTQISS